ncbi:MAG: archease [Candidatus Diapherotrites archaeon]
MSPKYSYLEHTSDILFEAYGQTQEELIANSAEALCNAMYSLEKVEPRESIELKVTAKDFEELLHKFLGELLLTMEVKLMFFKKFLVKKFSLEEGVLEVELKGEPINPEKHEIKSEIKAVTWHDFQARKEEGKWKARVLLDI